MRVVLAGGGSAGHIEPALALADALRQADEGISVTCLGTEQGLETRLVPLRGYQLELIPKVPLPRTVSAEMLTMPGRLAGSVHTVGKILDSVRADVLVGFGGYVSAPAYLAAKRHHVPIVVHEANPTPGFANRLGAMLTTDVFTGYPDTKLRGAQYVGLPIRRQIAELDRFKLGDHARAHFGLRPDLPVLLVTGGSQGAVSLNRAITGAVDAVRNAGVQILHVTGPKNSGEPPVPPGSVPYVAVPFVDRMDLAYAAADFALCRCGAMTCAELTAVGLPAVYVPLPHGNGEQRLNALPIVAKGGGMLVEDHELTADWIARSLLPVLTNIDHVAAMSEAASALGRKDADLALAKAVMDVVIRNQAASAAAPGGPKALGAAPGSPGLGLAQALDDNDPLDEPVSDTMRFRLDPSARPGGVPPEFSAAPTPQSFDAFAPSSSQPAGNRPQPGQYPSQREYPRPGDYPRRDPFPPSAPPEPDPFRSSATPERDPFQPAPAPQEARSRQSPLPQRGSSSPGRHRR
jgi:UDP-N-acetylglucosamine--N-acetylmuramyl-(pentapeptide) pyrophosphoryl-undecaprenol N-acetylglucosamine transferase